MSIKENPSLDADKGTTTSRTWVKEMRRNDDFSLFLAELGK
jgi:hypothetical protein